MTKKIKAYKAFNDDMTCKGFQYEVGKTYRHDGELGMCRSGFHACTVPFDCWDYYHITAPVAAVTVTDVKKDRDTSKVVGMSISIDAKLTLSEFIGEQIKYVFAFCKKSNRKIASGYSSNLAASRDYSKLAASRDSSKLAASGYSSKLAASGYSSKLAASGDSSKLAASGNSSDLAASGNYSNLAALGSFSNLAASGSFSNLTASGNYSHVEVSGKESIAAAIGKNSTAKAGKDGWIVLAEYGRGGKVLYINSAKVGQKGVNAGRTYKLANNKFVEV